MEVKQLTYSVGIDIGGTFTDLFMIDDETGKLFVSKTPTTPSMLKEGVLAAAGLAAPQAGEKARSLLEKASKLVHGTTVSSNAIFMTKGAKVGFITTAGFGDQIMIMRGYGRVAGLSLLERRHFRKTDKPPPLVSRENIMEVHERIDRDGKVLANLEEKEVMEAVRRFKAERIEAVAIGTLWSFRNPVNEKRIKEIVTKSFPGAFVSTSHELSPLIGEYERFQTTVANAFVGPLIRDYLDELSETLTKNGLKSPLFILQASGGVAPAEDTIPVNTIESGPAAGVIAAKFLADLMGIRNVIATDVGGTTFKVSIIYDGAWSYLREFIVNQYSLRVPAVDVSSIGTGGGSIASVRLGRLRIGPESAGADPGPACYGRGGTKPTVTDADVILGYVNPDNFLGGRIKLNRALAEKAVKAEVGDVLFGGNVVKAAAGIRYVMDNMMADLIRKCSIQRGYDPKEFVLMAYGGAGPTHVSGYASEAEIREAIVPELATVFSAFGAVVCDIHHSLKISDPRPAPADPDVVSGIFEQTETKAVEKLHSEGVLDEQMALSRWVDMRYRRQVHQLTIPIGNGKLTTEDLADLVRRFEAQYQTLYGKDSAYAEAGVELVTFGVDAYGRTKKIALPKYPRSEAGQVRSAVKGKRDVYWMKLDSFAPTTVYDGTRMKAGYEFEGPAIVEHLGTTIVVDPDQRARIDEHLNTVIDMGVSR